MSELALETVEQTTGDPVSGSVIWLHGLGADGHDFEAIVPELRLPDSLPLRFVFPHAPVRPVTLNGGMSMRAWYDIRQLSGSFNDEDETGIRESEKAICALIENEKKLGMPSDKIILAGFSQGGAMALHTGLRYPEKLAGIIALSAYLPLGNLLLAEVSAANQNIPIMMAHGTSDPLIPLMFAKASSDFLIKHGYQIDWHTYPMQHTVCSQEIRDLSQWLQRIC